MNRLDLTIQWATIELNKLKNGHATAALVANDGKIMDLDSIYVNKDSLLDDLLLIHRSLCETGNEKTANGKVVDVIRKVSAFGLTLVPLDIRQESTRHLMALDAITRYLGIGSYEQWDEATKLSWLQRELVSNRPLIRKDEWYSHPDIFSDATIDTLETFQMIAGQFEGSLSAYVISQAKAASDVLAVLLLQRDAGVKNPLRVVPLFETLDDLNGAAQTMDTLFSLPAYKGVINGKQEVMIGYSDSAKDAGRLAASWAQYETQEELVGVAKKHDIALTFFHGKGGTVGRGGEKRLLMIFMLHTILGLM
jgi:phosphoenolpyruvate carboxylase